MAPALPSGPGSWDVKRLDMCLQKTSQARNSPSSRKPSLMLLLTQHIHRALRVAPVTGSGLPGQWWSMEAVSPWLCPYRRHGVGQASPLWGPGVPLCTTA